MLSNPAIVTRYALENVLKVGYPCKCHLSPFESEAYKAFFTVENPSAYPQRIMQITVTCSACNQSQNFNVANRYLSELDVSGL